LRSANTLTMMVSTASTGYSKTVPLSGALTRCAAILHICQNTGDLNEELLYELADLIEAKIPHAENKHINNNES